MLVFKILMMLTNMQPGPIVDQVSEVKWWTIVKVVFSDVVGERTVYSTNQRTLGYFVERIIYPHLDMKQPSQEKKIYQQKGLHSLKIISLKQLEDLIELSLFLIVKVYIFSA